jgi:hypothetical protein|uniref:hypothetical protein n=3 Tax=Pseudomonas TaxID=286 RepID=UPI001C25D162|nr:hypothetical protein [Pseudomonas aeruginosa]
MSWMTDMAAGIHQIFVGLSLIHQLPSKHRIGNHNFLAIAIQENKLTARPEAGSDPHEEIAVDAGLAPPYNLNPLVVKLLTRWSIASIAPWAHGVNGKRNSDETIT